MVVMGFVFQRVEGMPRSIQPEIRSSKSESSGSSRRFWSPFSNPPPKPISAFGFRPSFGLRDFGSNHTPQNSR